RRRERPFFGAAISEFLSGSLRRRGLLLARDAHPAGTLAAARVGLGALPANREAAAVAPAPGGADLLKAFDVLRAAAAEVTLHLAGLDRLAELDDLVLGQVLDLGVRVDPGLLEDVVGRRAADSEDVGEPDLGSLVEGDVDSRDARHQPCLCLW